MTKFYLDFERLREIEEMDEKDANNPSIQRNNDDMRDILFYLGKTKYLLGKFQEAFSCFEESARQGLIAWEKEPWGMSYPEDSPAAPMLDSAILSRNKEIRDECVNTILSDLSMINIDIKNYERIMSHLILGIGLCHFLKGSIEECLPLIDLIQEYEKMEVKDTNLVGSKYVGRAFMLEGLIKGDKERIIEGIIPALEQWKVEKFPVPFDVDVLTVLVLAKENGIVITEEDIPEKLQRPIFRFFEEED